MKHQHNEDHHDDHGGFQRDLRATGAAINRRALLRLAATLGGGAGLTATLSVAI
jgi:hypothetical protein